MKTRKEMRVEGRGGRRGGWKEEEADKKKGQERR